ncbi:MarR family winged helix-turn-helix transcriptional regulator [Streptomyces chrestomyceticus]|uniref:MarR family winged helix-turn-helix transcriptional regulator n=1 Tax=Streptomyces chrestomyceticus TaxID=68185 RepID=UPI0033D76818
MAQTSTGGDRLGVEVDARHDVWLDICVAEPLLPAVWNETVRCVFGAALATAALAILCVLPLSPTALPPLLALLGFGLGVFTPANNAVIMTAIPASCSGTGGGLVNMARATGTALGVALITISLQLPDTAGWPTSPQRAALILLAASTAALLFTWQSHAAHHRATGRLLWPLCLRSPRPRGPAAASTPDARLLTEAVTRLRRALRASIRSDYPWETLPMAQVELLQALAEHSPARVGDLAARRRLAFSTVSGLITQMINTGLVSRITVSSDRRASAVALTDTGRAQLTAWQDAHQHRLHTALQHLPLADRAALRAALPALLRIADLLDHAPAEAEQPTDHTTR